MKKFLLLVLFAVTAVTAHAQLDTTIVTTTAVVINKKAYIRTTTTTVSHSLVTAEMLVKNRRDENNSWDDRELERLQKLKAEKKAANAEQRRLLKQALVTSGIEIEAKTEEELNEIKQLQAAAKKEKVKPIK